MWSKSHDFLLPLLAWASIQDPILSRVCSWTQASTPAEGSSRGDVHVSFIPKNSFHSHKQPQGYSSTFTKNFSTWLILFFPLKTTSNYSAQHQHPHGRMRGSGWQASQHSLHRERWSCSGNKEFSAKLKGPARRTRVRAEACWARTATGLCPSRNNRPGKLGTRFNKNPENQHWKAKASFSSLLWYSLSFPIYPPVHWNKEKSERSH